MCKISKRYKQKQTITAVATKKTRPERSCGSQLHSALPQGCGNSVRQTELGMLCYVLPLWPPSGDVPLRGWENAALGGGISRVRIGHRLRLKLGFSDSQTSRHHWKLQGGVRNGGGPQAFKEKPRGRGGAFGLSKIVEGPSAGGLGGMALQTKASSLLSVAVLDETDSLCLSIPFIDCST